MCGVTGVCSSRNIKYNIENNLNFISHRGPDDSGVFYSDLLDVQFGHVRLSILDTSIAGHQPMFSHDNRYVMVFNGEIYNYNELKQYLESTYGYRIWKSSTDTEVILEGFVLENSKFFEKLNGIFAILLYDTQQKLLYVIRDPMGVKPLYYSSQNGNFYFSSEVKGLLSFIDVKKTLRLQSLADQLALMYVPEPYTMFEEIFKLRPGSLYVFKSGELISEKNMFSSLTEVDEIDNTNINIVDEFSTVFSKAINRQLISDVPISLFLSGGLDSSAIAYEAVNQGALISNAYTISQSNLDQLSDGQSSDLFYANKMAKYLGLKLNVIEAESNFINLLPDLVDFLEDGISDPAAINTYLISKKAREDGYKVMLSGQGADEYLGGYRRHRAEKLLTKIPDSIKKILNISGYFLPNTIHGKFNPHFRRLKKITKAAGQIEEERLLGYYIWEYPEKIKSLFLNGVNLFPAIDLYNHFKKNKNSTISDRLLSADQEFDLRSLNLAYSDKMSMMVGLEIRVPFLDFELVKLMNSIPYNFKVNGSLQKYILKKSMKNCLPEDVINRSKAGFSLPIRSWFVKKNEFLSYYLDENRLKKQGIYNSDEIKKMYNDQVTGKKDNAYVLFSLLCQQVWLDKYI